MQCEAVEYWKVRRDYAGEPFFRLDRDRLSIDFGQEFTEALVSFLNAHYTFNDLEDLPSEEEKLKLVSVMTQARAILGEVDPYLFVDALRALEHESSK